MQCALNTDLFYLNDSREKYSKHCALCLNIYETRQCMNAQFKSRLLGVMTTLKKSSQTLISVCWMNRRNMRQECHERVMHVCKKKNNNSLRGSNEEKNIKLVQLMIFSHTSECGGHKNQSVLLLFNNSTTHRMHNAQWCVKYLFLYFFDIFLIFLYDNDKMRN